MKLFELVSNVFVDDFFLHVFSKNFSIDFDREFEKDFCINNLSLTFD